MATYMRRTAVHTDDLTGEVSDNLVTVSFSLDGETLYSVDLSPANAAHFRQTLGGVERRLAKYMAHASSVTNISARTGKTAHMRKSPGQVAAMRMWARQKGFNIADRGRIPTEIVDAFEADMD